VRSRSDPDLVPADLKTIVRLMADGFLIVDDEAPALIFAQQIVRGMRDPMHSAAHLRLFAEAGKVIGKAAEAGGRGGGMRIEFHKRAYDPLADPAAPPKPLRMLGQIWGPDGKTIVDARTGKPVALPSDGSGEREKPLEEDDGLGEGDDALEVVDDPMPLEDPHGV
jgi:hypothetical protein